MTSMHKTLVAVALLASALAAQAQEIKIGFVNLDRVLRDAAAAKTAAEQAATSRLLATIALLLLLLAVVLFE